MWLEQITTRGGRRASVASSSRRLLALGAFAVLMAAAPAASAQDAADKAAAESLFDAGKKLLKQKNYSEACPKFEESQRLDPGVGTLLFLAECYEQNGQTASAWATFREAAAEAKKAGDKREKIARTRADKLDDKLSKLVVRVNDAVRVPGLEVKRDGEPVTEALWGTDIPVDPGDHTIEVSAPGKLPYSTTVKVEPGSQKVAVDVPELQDAPVEAPPPEPKPATPPPAPPQQDPVQDAPVADEGPNYLGIGLVGLGVVGVGVGTFFGLKASGKNSDADKECLTSDPTQCSQAGADLGQEAEDAALISTIGFGVGAVALVSGLVILFTGGDSADEQARVKPLRLTPVAHRHGGGLWLRGAF